MNIFDKSGAGARSDLGNNRNLMVPEVSDQNSARSHPSQQHNELDKIHEIAQTPDASGERMTIQAIQPTSSESGFKPFYFFCVL